MTHQRRRAIVAAAATVVAVAMSGCSQPETFAWDEMDVVVLTSTGTAGSFLEQDHGRLWGVRSDGSHELLETDGLEMGQLLVSGQALLFDEREASLSLDSGGAELVRLERARQEQMFGMLRDPQGDRVMRLFNEGYGLDG